MSEPLLPVGKLPPELLVRLLANAPTDDPRLVVGPGPGIDCAVLDMGDEYLVFKSDPITFAADEIGWYLVQVNANDIVTTGARPRWLLVTLLLPEGATTASTAQTIMAQVCDACRELDIVVLGGHTEITHGLARPLAVGTMIGSVAPDRLVTPRGARPGDAVLLTKGVPIEGTAVLAREFPDILARILSRDALEEAQGYLYEPGISVVRDAEVALASGTVTAMHDPTEGGLAAALWELAEVCGHTLLVDKESILVPDLAVTVCAAFDLDPLATLASGALLLTTPADDVAGICDGLEDQGITCAQIGTVASGPIAVYAAANGERRLMRRPDRDELGRAYEQPVTSATVT